MLGDAEPAVDCQNGPTGPALGKGSPRGWSTGVRRRACERAGTARAPAELVAFGDLQLPGDRRLRPDLRQRQHHGRARLRAARIPRGRRVLAAVRSTRTSSPPSRPRPSTCSARAGTRSSTAFARRTAAGAGCATSSGWFATRPASPRRWSAPGATSPSARRPSRRRRGARERIERLLATSPAVIYSFKASDDYAPTFISRNVKDLLGYEREDYLASPDFWQSRIHPDDQERVLGEFERLWEDGPSQQRVPVPQGRRQSGAGSATSCT